MFKKKKSAFCSLVTPFEGESDITWENTHPRPTMRREAVQLLCGTWSLSLKTAKGLVPLGDISVPFPPESRLSGIEKTLQRGELFVYEKVITLDSRLRGGRVLLHFGAVDQVAEVYLNGKLVGEHIGGYLPFSFDVTAYLAEGENTLCVVVEDNLDRRYGYGKQRKRRGGMWYTPISGIWQPVWLEGVPESYIEELTLTPTSHAVEITTRGGEAKKEILLETGERFSFEGDFFRLPVENPVYWTPENPKLYTFTLFCGKDKIDSYFALRTVTCECIGGTPTLCLNGKPYFFHGLLDQGYFADGIYTPATPEGYLYDVKLAKDLGFNMLRKHIKIEPEIFYYYCDKYGIAVFQDMVNSGGYSFLLDTALPTVGIKRGLQRPAGRVRRQHFEKSAKETLRLLHNHPSVCYYTIFNEGWGQYRGEDALYRELKGMESGAVFDTASGWFRTRESDVESEHVYFKKVKMKPSASRPLVLSEFGGYSLKVEGHSFNPWRTYGYRNFETAKGLTKALAALYRDEILPHIPRGLSATVLTQISDVEDEVNGLVTYDRQVVKTEAAEMRKIADGLYAIHREVWEGKRVERE